MSRMKPYTKYLKEVCYESITAECKKYVSWNISYPGIVPKFADEMPCHIG
jgi:hypothetical protein